MYLSTSLKWSSNGAPHGHPRLHQVAKKKLCISEYECVIGFSEMVDVKTHAWMGDHYLQSVKLDCDETFKTSQKDM